MKEITVSSSRLPIRTGSRVPGYPDLTVGKKLGGSPYTLDRIYDLVKKDGTSAGIVIKVCWQPLGFPLGMSLRALEHEWVLYNDMEVFCCKHPELSVRLLHAQAAIFTSERSSSIYGCCPGVPCCKQQQHHPHQQQQQQHGSNLQGQQQRPQHLQCSDSGSNSGSSSSGGVQIHEVSQGEAAASISSTTSTPIRTTAALIVEKADGLTVKQRIKKPEFHNIRYIAQLLLQLPPLLAVLENELGFVHDDLRLDNVMESWQQQQQQQQQQGPTAASSSSSGSHHVADLAPAGAEISRQRQQQPEGSAEDSSSSSTPVFKLFDFGLSIINPDRYSRGDESRAKPEQKKEALRQLQQQGYAFHKALGAVNLAHVVQFGRAADIYRLCKSLIGQLNKRTWPETDRHLVEACLQLLATVSGTTVTAYFRPGKERRTRAPRHGGQQQQQQGSVGQPSQEEMNDVPSTLANTGARIKITIAAEPVLDKADPGSSSSRDTGMGRIGHWFKQRQLWRKLHREAVAITARQLMQMKQYQQLERMMATDKA